MDKMQFYQRTGGAIRAYLAQELKIDAGIHYQVKRGIDGPRVLAMYLVVNPRWANRIMALSEQLSMAAGLDPDVSIRIDRGPGGTLAVEIPKPEALWYNLSIRDLPPRGGLRATIGLDNLHRPTLVDFAAPLTPHALVAGTTGSGKTNVARLIAYDLAKQNGPADLRFLFIDTGKNGRGWRPFARLPHLLHPVIADDDTAARALAWAVAEIDRRSRADQVTPRVVLGIDEAQSLLEQKNGPYVRAVGTVARLGREVGVHLLLGLQNPTAAALGDTAIKRNLSVRLVGKTDGADAAKVAAGLPGTGAEKLVTAGDMLLVRPGGTQRLTACLLTDRDTGDLPAGDPPDALDLSEYEDPAHVLDQADNAGKPGRKPDPLDLARLGELVGLLGTGGEVSNYTLARAWGWFSGKVDRHIEAADEVLAGLTEAGFRVDLLSNEMQ